jgi:YrbI family 3-deoxy-D-manno-octulosonate 8-phosphate phosphatase
MLILSRERNPVVTARGTKLGVEVLQGVDDKASALTEWAAQYDVRLDRIAYVGNDINDLAAMVIVGWPIAVADARPEVLAAARTVLTARGGHGAVREATDRILASRSRPTNAYVALAASQTPTATNE